LPDGKTYYHHLLFAETGSSRSEKELVQMLLAQFQEEQAAIRSLTQQSPSLLSMLSEGITEDFPIPEPEEMLSDLQSCMINDFLSRNTTSLPLPLRRNGVVRSRTVPFGTVNLTYGTTRYPVLPFTLPYRTRYRTVNVNVRY